MHYFGILRHTPDPEGYFIVQTLYAVLVATSIFSCQVSSCVSDNLKCSVTIIPVMISDHGTTFMALKINSIYITNEESIFMRYLAVASKAIWRGVVCTLWMCIQLPFMDAEMQRSR